MKRDMSPVLDVAPEQMREAMYGAYRLQPDERFRIAVTEIPRLLGAPTEAAVRSTFEGGRWTILSGEAVVGTLPELPGFRDYLDVLSAWAKNVRKKAGRTVVNAPTTGIEAVDDGSGFLWTKNVADLREIDRRWREDGPSPRLAAGAARCLARLSFQMADRVQIGDLVPGRALAALAIMRADRSGALLREELLLSHAMGYTQHAANIGRTLHATDSLRLFTELADDALAERAAVKGASEETRYLALERVASRDEYTQWEEARARLFGAGDEAALAPAMLHVDLQGQVEDNVRRHPVSKAVTRALLNELGGKADVEDDELEVELERVLAVIGKGEGGPFWDGASRDAWYRSAVYSGVLEAFPSDSTPTGAALRKAASLPSSDIREALSYLKEEKTVGEPTFFKVASGIRNRLTGDRPELSEATRLFVRRADARPSHRSDLVWMMRWSTFDLRAAESLSRSILIELADVDRPRKLSSALFVGEMGTASRLVLASECSAQDATGMLWNWDTERLEPDLLSAAFEAVMRRHPESWELTYQYIEFLRDRKQFEKAYAASSAWIARYGRPGATGTFHSHVVQTFGAIRLGRFEEALKEYRAYVAPSNRRLEALALNGAGDKEEAQKIIQAVAGSSDYPDDLGAWLEILWTNGKWAEAANAVGRTAVPLTSGTWYDVIRPAFETVFLDAPSEGSVAAMKALRQEHVAVWDLATLAEPFAAAGKWETALRIQAAIEPPSAAGEERLIESFGYMKKWKGEKAADAWLEQIVPPAERNPIGIKAYNADEFHLLWDFIETPDSGKYPEVVWLFRACASARLAGKDPHRSELVAHYSTTAEERYKVVGRYLLGLATEQELFATATDQVRRGEVAWGLAVKAHGEGRYEDASDWYRVCAEVDDLHGVRNHAVRLLVKWARGNQALFRVRAQGL